MNHLLALMTLSILAADGALAQRALAEQNQKPAQAALDDTPPAVPEKTAETPPEEAKVVPENKSGADGESNRLARVKTLARTDPARAAELAVKLFPRESYDDGEPVVSYPRGFSHVQGMRNPPAEMNQLIECFDTPEIGFRSTNGSVAVVSVAEQWAKNDPEKAAEWALSTGSSKAVATVAGAWTKKDPAKGCNFGLKVANPWLRDAVVASLCRQWASQDPAKAAAWVAQLEHDHGMAKPRSAYFVAAEWAAKDLERAAQWAISLGRGSAMRFAVEAVASQQIKDLREDAAEAARMRKEGKVPEGKGQRFRRIWHEDSDVPIEKVPTPEGFKISPAEAYNPSRELVSRPFWMQWHLYVDSTNYYIVVYRIGEETPVGKEYRSAIPKHSWMIDGTTGKRSSYTGE